MNESSDEGGQRSWFERLSQVLGGEPQDREQLLESLRNAEQREILDGEALAMIEGVLQVGDMRVRDIMVPRAQMVVIDEDEAPEAFIEVIIESGHSRFPVVGASRDEVRGILLAKDLLMYFARNPSQRFDFDDAMRPAVHIPESKRLNVLLREFRQSRNHMAVVVDEYGGVSGLVTIEDVLEQIVGEIDDEHDVDDEAYVKQLAEHEYIVQSRTPIEEFNESFGTDFSDDEFDTIGGVVINSFGHLPTREETLSSNGLRFEVLRADKRRVHLFRVFTQVPDDDADSR